MPENRNSEWKLETAKYFAVFSTTWTAASCVHMFAFIAFVYLILVFHNVYDRFMVNKGFR